MSYGNITKATYQADIKRKQSFFNRCARRCKAAKTVAEKTFLKNEAKRICTELKSCSKNWKKFGFGGSAWITKSFTMSKFNNVAGSLTGARKTSSRSSARRTSRTRSSVRRGTSRSTARNRTRSTAARRSYVAW